MWFIFLMLANVQASSLQCGELKTIYNSQNCCQESNITCVHTLPSCLQGQILISDGNGGWDCGDLPSASIPTINGSTPTTNYYLVDRESVPANCVLQSANDIENNKQAFIEQYNAEGIPPYSEFQSGNCCIAVADGTKLIISGTPYGYQFPASTSGGIRCNPSGGYTDSGYKFYRAPILTMEQTFSSRAACSTSHNPAIAVCGS